MNCLQVVHESEAFFFYHLEVSYMLQHEKGVDCLCVPQVVSQIPLELQIVWYKSICSRYHLGHMRVLFCNNARFDTQQRNKLLAFPCKELVAVCGSYAPPPATSITWSRKGGFSLKFCSGGGCGYF